MMMNLALNYPGILFLAEGDDDMRFKAASTSLPCENKNEATESDSNSVNYTGLSAHHQSQITEYTCTRCNLSMESSDALQSHQDWHFAKDLQDEDHGRNNPPSKITSTTSSKKPSQGSNKKKTARGRSEKGQSKLAFG